MSAWMFKGNPSVFYIDTYLRSYNPIWWTLGGPVKRFDGIRPGDPVFMFSACHGVIGVGRARSGPTTVEECAVLVHHWFRLPWRMCDFIRRMACCWLAN